MAIGSTVHVATRLQSGRQQSVLSQAAAAGLRGDVGPQASERQAMCHGLDLNVKGGSMVTMLRDHGRDPGADKNPGLLRQRQFS